MYRPLRAGFGLVGAAVLAVGCATTPQGLAASGDVHALLIAIRDNDLNAFNARVDRRALDSEIQAVMVEKTRGSGMPASARALGLVLSGPLSRLAGDAFIQPDVFRAVADYYGYRPDTRIPGALALSTVLSPLPDGRVCVRDRKLSKCIITFAEEQGTWKLVAFDAESVLRGRTGRVDP